MSIVPDISDNGVLMEKRQTRGKKYLRPSTAPSREDVVELPSLPTLNKLPEQQSRYMQTVNEDEDLSSIGDSISPSVSHTSSAPLASTTRLATEDPQPCDWATFIQAYSLGRWNPHRTPNPPSSSHVWYAQANAEAVSQLEAEAGTEKDLTPLSPTPQSSTIKSTNKRSIHSNAASSPSHPLSAHRLRNSFSTPSALPTGSKSNKPDLFIPLSTPSNPFLPGQFISSHPPNPLYSSGSPSAKSMHVNHNQYSMTSHHHSQTLAATLRLAGTHVDISPLALPSPEHELTDPMRGLKVTIPGIHRRDYHDSDSEASAEEVETGIAQSAPETTSKDEQESGRSTPTTLRKPRIFSSKARISDGGAVLVGGGDIVTTPGGTRKRLSARMESLKEFWVGMQDVDEHYGGMTPPIGAGQETIPPEDSHKQPNPPALDGEPKSGIVDESIKTYEPRPPLETEMRHLSEGTDYFSQHLAATPSRVVSMSVPLPPPTSYTPPISSSSSLASSSTSSSSSMDSTTLRRFNLTRHTSAPLPASASTGGVLPASLVKKPVAPPAGSPSSPGHNTASPDVSMNIPAFGSPPPVQPHLIAPIIGVPLNSEGAGGPLQPEEILYHQLGYLTPPNPPNEIERRRALYKFNIWSTGSDINFDRIAHLAKLVFNTKGVVISLIDGNEQWFKSEWGVKLSALSRNHSFCGHTILQPDDEPMVVLDTHLDWRFAKNPLVTGDPHVRFYAGAPLRTQDGFNIGSLVVLDDAPREGFTPRHRHTLKEFAAIAMREMELWRDKIQLRIRDRIQNSMEEFSRECLEIDMEEPSPTAVSSSSSSSSAPSSADSLTTPTQNTTSPPPAEPRQRLSQPSNINLQPPPPAHQNHSGQKHPAPLLASSMDKVYSRAAKLIQRTLDVEGVIVMDVSHCEVLEPTASIPAAVTAANSVSHFSTTTTTASSLTTSSSAAPLHHHPASNSSYQLPSSSSFTSAAEGTVSVTMYDGDPDKETRSKTLTGEEYVRLMEFFAKYPHGRVFEGVVPVAFRMFLPGRMRYALTVPIFNIDKRPFALLCAYNASDLTKRFLEGHELSYLRAIGVIILSAVLKRRMILADKAKSLFISNISHELRTPLHGILAAAELLADSSLDHSQRSFLQTVQACGTSLVETVNHVLDFTKLSGNSKSGGVENVIVSSKVDLLQLLEDAIDGCWIGHRARMAGDSLGIGSVYSPPKNDEGPPSATRRKHVETVIDVGYRKEGWLLKCEKGGVRRILMNVFGNSLKFTTDGFVHVMLRQVPAGDDESPNKVKIELSVQDTGKGISQNFLKNQLFHPFSQENPLQTGTGLGLAIVNSILQTDSVNGKIDVWSEEGVGTEIKVTFSAEVPESAKDEVNDDLEPFKFAEPGNPAKISLVGFDSDYKGVQLLQSVLQRYLVSWWGFELQPLDQGYGDIVICNEDINPVIAATEDRDTSRPFVILSASRGSPTVMTIASEHERIGGFCRVVYKPGGPSRLHAVLKLCLHTLQIASRSRPGSPQNNQNTEQEDSLDERPSILYSPGQAPTRRNSEENGRRVPPKRPLMSPRSMTVHPLANRTWKTLMPPAEADEIEVPDQDLTAVVPAVTLGSGGTLLKSSIGALQPQEHQFRVLVVEDNAILRNLLAKWLLNKGYDFRDAVDGQDGVNVYRDDGPFDIVLLDMSMPILDGIGATSQIRQIEHARANVPDGGKCIPTKILALTGMSSLEDKRRAFEAGVDGYLVKPVAFKTLDEMFHKLGIS